MLAYLNLPSLSLGLVPRWAGRGIFTQQRQMELISDLPARDNPRGRLAGDQCIPPGALHGRQFRQS